jgi:hypothetical protein
MSSRSLSAILSRAGGYDALLELLELGDDMAELQKWIGQIWNLAADDARLDAIFPALAQAESVSLRLGSAYHALDGQREGR